MLKDIHLSIPLFGYTNQKDCLPMLYIVLNIGNESEVIGTFTSQSAAENFARQWEIRTNNEQGGAHVFTEKEYDEWCAFDEIESEVDYTEWSEYA
jgi:hypothetical protein